MEESYGKRVSLVYIGKVTMYERKNVCGREYEGIKYVWESQMSGNELVEEVWRKQVCGESEKKWWSLKSINSYPVADLRGEYDTFSDEFPYTQRILRSECWNLMIKEKAEDNAAD